MAHLVIEGGRRLSGRIAVEGNKNAALPLLAACLLTSDTCEIRNLPRIRDVAVMIDLLRVAGRRGRGGGPDDRQGHVSGHSRVRSRTPRSSAACAGSVLLLGALLGRVGRAELAPPGGDFPARRTITTHLHALVALGARIVDDADGHRLEAPNGLTGASMYLVEASVTGTETALLAAAQARGRSEIRHAACEPHVVELCEFLAAMGADVRGGGTSTISIEPTGRLARRGSHAARRLHRGGVVGRRRRRDRAATSRSPAPTRRTWSRSPPSSR